MPHRTQSGDPSRTGDDGPLVSIRVSTRETLEESNLLATAARLIEEDHERHRRMAEYLARLIRFIEQSDPLEKEPIVTGLDALRQEHLAIADGEHIWGNSHKTGANGHGRLFKSLRTFETGC